MLWRSAASSPRTTVHAPQSPSAHPSFVPVRPATSRKYSSTVVVGGSPDTLATLPSSMKRTQSALVGDVAWLIGALAAAVGGITPWRYQQRDVVVLLGAGYAESNHDLVEERRLGQLRARSAEIFGDVESQGIAAGVQRASLQQGLCAAAVFVRLRLCQQARRIHAQVVKLDAHSGGGSTCCEMQHMSRERDHGRPHESGSGCAAVAARPRLSQQQKRPAAAYTPRLLSTIAPR